MPLPEPRVHVRPTDDAVADLRRLKEKDPQIAREVFKKVLLQTCVLDQISGTATYRALHAKG